MTDRYGRLRVLFVCTANICRSPTAELLARATFGEERSVFRSAGFLEGGRSVPDTLVDVLGERGVDAGAHRSYRIDDASIRAADLLLTMESEHLQRIVTTRPDALAKTVPLREAAELLGRSGRDPVELTHFLALVEARRDPRTYLGTAWDVTDPYGGRARAYRSAVDEIAQLVGVVGARLG